MDSSEVNIELTITCGGGKLDWMIALISPTLVFLPFLSLFHLCFTIPGLF